MDTMEDIISSIEYNTNYNYNKKISFADCNDVLYIQSKDDDSYYSKKYEIWWGTIDYHIFRAFAGKELSDVILQQKILTNNIITVKQAMQILYQP